MKSLAPLLVVLVLLAAACGSDSTPDSTDSADPADSTAGSDALIGEWQLEGGTLDGAAFPLVDQRLITMALRNDGSIGGTAACNGYGGTYELDGSTLKLTDISSTEMGCEPDVMASEAAFHQALQRSLQLGRDGEALTMRGDGVDLIFNPVPPVENAAIVGTSWELDTIFAGETAGSVQGNASLVLDPDGSFTGSTGCRDLTGRYVIDGDSLRVSELSAQGDCLDELQGQDSAVMRVLENAQLGAADLEVAGNRLTLMTAGDDGLGYRAR